jgi:hypothetical protein
VFCRELPDIAAVKDKWLRWNAADQSGSYGGMWLSLRDGEQLVVSQELPRPWPEAIAGVLCANGRLSDDTFDDFLAWSKGLAERARGAIMHEDGKLTYLWIDRDAMQERARTLIANRDFAALAQLLRDTKPLASISAAHHCVRDAAWPALEGEIRRGEAIEVALALYEGIGGTSNDPRSTALDAVIVAAGQLPQLSSHTALQAAVEKARHRRAWIEREHVDAQARARTVPIEPSALARFVEEVARGDALSIAVLNHSQRTANVALVQAITPLVRELAQSGRVLPADAIEVLATYGYSMADLDDEPTRAAFVEHGELAKALVAKRAASVSRERDERDKYKRVMAERRAQLAKRSPPKRK